MNPAIENTIEPACLIPALFDEIVRLTPSIPGCDTEMDALHADWRNLAPGKEPEFIQDLIESINEICPDDLCFREFPQGSGTYRYWKTDQPF